MLDDDDDDAVVVVVATAAFAFALTIKFPLILCVLVTADIVSRCVTIYGGTKCTLPFWFFVLLCSLEEL